MFNFREIVQILVWDAVLGVPYEKDSIVCAYSRKLDSRVDSTGRDSLPIGFAICNLKRIMDEKLRSCYT